MDALDKISLGIIVILLAGSAVVVETQLREVKPDRSIKQTLPASGSAVASQELSSASRIIRNLMEAGNLAKAETLARELVQSHPYEGESHMLLGDLYMRKQEPLKAVHEYKEAVELNPDYLDKKTPLFQGKKLKVSVGEALAEIERQVRSDPGNDALKSEKKLIYYLYRKIAGSCG